MCDVKASHVPVSVDIFRYARVKHWYTLKYILLIKHKIKINNRNPNNMDKAF